MASWSASPRLFGKGSFGLHFGQLQREQETDEGQRKRKRAGEEESKGMEIESRRLTREPGAVEVAGEV
jgi:hypothetical protein